MSTTPEDILSSVSRPNGWTGWIPTLTGGFTPFDPKVEDVRTQDIIWGLAGTWRFGGGSNPRMTVAEHAVGVSRIIETLWGREFAAIGLLHDACEAYTHDMQSPLRPYLQVILPTNEIISWDELDRRVNVVVFKALGLDPELLNHPQVRAADILSATFEKKQSLSLDQEDDWGLPPVPPELVDFKYEFWDPRDSYRHLSARWHELELPVLK